MNLCVYKELVKTYHNTVNLYCISNIRPQIRRDYPLNLSILISGGKETNKDSLSNGERKGKSPAPNLVSPGCKDMWRLGRDIACAEWLTKSLLNGAIAQGGC